MITKFVIAVMSTVVALSSIFGFGYEAPIEEAEEIQNVIIMIGDGMGFNHLYATQEEYGIELEMLTRTEYQGKSITHSANSPITDSAAGGTALATGSKTCNSKVGVYPLDPLQLVATPTNITEVAMEHGLSTGIVTSDSITGATPSDFSVHVSDRDMSEEIFAQQVVSNIDLIWGSTDSDVTKEACDANGKILVDSLSDVQALNLGDKSIGQFDCNTLWRGTDNGDNPTLSELTVEAIDFLNQDEDGFFLMVEGAHIDKRSHDNDKEEAMIAVLEFDKAVSEAIDFAEKDGHTLVIVTADHETGAVTKIMGEYTWISGTHSCANVPLLVYGCDSFIKDGEVVENIEIPERAVAFMTNNEVYFPCPHAYFYKED